ncbi:MAG TPA: hypothetical protein VE127_15545 [Solirubrobacteraceae bacterium]|nr:hypothetical protein [Solirubrobacteraceae bacterium]
MELELIALPYHDGRADFGMGVGPTVLSADEQLQVRLQHAGWRVSIQRVEAVDEKRPEIARVI